jgi:hypothetical protein
MSNIRKVATVNGQVSAANSTSCVSLNADERYIVHSTEAYSTGQSGRQQDFTGKRPRTTGQNGRRTALWYNLSKNGKDPEPTGVPACNAGNE